MLTVETRRRRGRATTRFVPVGVSGMCGGAGWAGPGAGPAGPRYRRRAVDHSAAVAVHRLRPGGDRRDPALHLLRGCELAPLDSASLFRRVDYRRAMLRQR